MICHKTQPNQIIYIKKKLVNTLVGLKDTPSTYGLFNAEIWLIYKCVIMIRTMYRLGLVNLFNLISSPCGLFNIRTWFMWKFTFGEFSENGWENMHTSIFTHLCSSGSENQIIYCLNTRNVLVTQSNRSKSSSQTDPEINKFQSCRVTYDFFPAFQRSDLFE